MARHRKRPLEPAPQARVRPAAPVRAVRGAHAGVESPARLLQAGVAAAVNHVPEDRWSARRTLGFVVVTNGAFWAALGAGIWALAHR